jgi:uncharacterized OB-fold protein
MRFQRRFQDMVQEPAIVATGYHIPSFAVKAGEEGFEALPEGAREVSVAAFDEDVTTMAVEAARWALNSAGVEGRDVAALLLASSEGLDQEVVLHALGLEEPVVDELEGDSRDRMLPMAFDRAGESGLTLAIASHAPAYDACDPLERGLGAGAAAFLLDRKAGVRLVTTASGESGETRIEGLFPITGDLGFVSPHLDLAEALSRSREGQKVTMAFGRGESGTTLSFRVDTLPGGPEDISREIAANRTHMDRAKYEALRDQRAGASITTSMGAYISPAAYSEHPDARYRLVGRRCVECGTLSFNPRAACIHCGSTEFEAVPLKPTGSVYAVTTIGQGGAPTEFAPLQAAMGPYGVAVVELDDGPRLTAMLTDCDPSAVAIGDPVRATFRRIYTQDGLTRYGLKFRPRSVKV